MRARYLSVATLWSISPWWTGCSLRKHLVWLKDVCINTPAFSCNWIFIFLLKVCLFKLNISMLAPTADSPKIQTKTHTCSITLFQRSPKLTFINKSRYILKILSHTSFLPYFSSPLLWDKWLPSSAITFFPLLTEDSPPKTSTGPMLHSCTASTPDLPRPAEISVLPLPEQFAVLSFYPERWPWVSCK